MSTLMDGISTINSLSTQIARLQAGEQVDPNTIKLALEQSFNDMLTSLISTNNDDDEDDDSFDPFSFMNYSDPNLSIDTLEQGTGSVNEVDNAAAILNPNQSLNDPSYLDSLSQLSDNPLALQGYVLEVGSI